jgi:hypothetical protein
MAAAKSAKSINNPFYPTQNGMRKNKLCSIDECQTSLACNFKGFKPFFFNTGAVSTGWPLSQTLPYPKRVTLNEKAVLNLQMHLPDLVLEPLG